MANREDTLATFRRVRAIQAIDELQKQSVENGLDKMDLEEVNREIQAVRKSRRIRAMLKRVVHPGEILQDELAELEVSPATFARQIDVPPDHIGQIISGKCSVDSDTALRFGHWFGVDPLFWLNLQMQFDLVIADRQVGAAVRALPTAQEII